MNGGAPATYTVIWLGEIKTQSTRSSTRVRCPVEVSALHVEIRRQFRYLLELVRGFFASLLIAHKFGSFFLLPIPLRRNAVMLRDKDNWGNPFHVIQIQEPQFTLFQTRDDRRDGRSLKCV